MLISNQDLCAQPLPLLLVGPNRRWQLVTAVNQSDEQFSYQVTTIDESGIKNRVVICESPPFHVGDEVWELDYGLQIVSIKDSSHPAMDLWRRWKQQDAT